MIKKQGLFGRAIRTISCYLAFAVWNLLFGICCLGFVICYLEFVTWDLLFAIRYLEFDLSSGILRLLH